MSLLLAIALSFIPAFCYACIVYWLDRFEKEPKRLLGGVFVWGALVATIGAIFWSLLLGLGIYFITGSEGATDVAGAVLVAPLVEESLKGMAIIIVFLAFRREFDNVLDGIVYGAVVGLGFAATENVLYLMQAYSEGGLGDMLVLFVIRVILGGWGHAVYTAFIGMGLAYARLSRNPAVYLLAPVGGWVIAVFLHALHNGMAVFLAESAGLGGFVALLLVDWTGWAIALGVVVWEIFRERHWMATYLRDEVQRGTLSESHYRTAHSMRAQFAARWKASGPNRRATRRFYQLCAELSHKLHQQQRLGDEGGNSRIIESLRAELARLAPVAVV
ncbi:MAG: PrsW family intramembrane metalloprotease [Chloroflexaceae bacterium]|jgi:RsiW-degrading membrane proteinase PrsW (M82 family)|nr:PrsW family intramembrane metalloprotease [Chloroflexaceae bacterium]